VNEEIEFLRRAIKRFEDPIYVSDLKKQLKNARALNFSLFCDQPERSKREDSSKDEMRCSEHCGNTVREVQ